ncbi:MAG: Fe-S protein assembly co-chaperone HscB [Myxococcales bacterium]|nr:Fe-S protein assembly co-chaperone HscB [Myxococcales bacterium]
MSHFEVFGLPPSFHLDLDALERRYRELSLELHPDRARGDGAARRAAVERTTALNDAYRVLKDPERRACYLLCLAGVDLEHDERAGSGLPPEFLERILSLHEELDAARRSAALEEVRRMGAEVKAERQALLDQAASALATAPADRAAIDRAAGLLAKVRYFSRFLEEVDQIEEEALE